MRKNRKVRTAASLAVTVVLSAAVFLLFLSIELLMGYFSPRSFREALRLSGYAVEMEQEMLTKQKELFASHGLPESLAGEIFGDSKAYMAFYRYVDEGAVKDGAEDLSPKEALEAYLKEQNVYETGGVQSAVAIVAEESETICKRYIYPAFVREYQQYVQEKKPVFISLAVGAAITGAVCILLLFLWYRSRHHALYYVTGSIFTAAVWNVAGTVLISVRGKGFETGIGTAYYREFLEIFMTRGMYPWYIVSIAVTALAVLLLVISIRMRNR